jgi:hypothetical protein
MGAAPRFAGPASGLEAATSRTPPPAWPLTEPGRGRAPKGIRLLTYAAVLCWGTSAFSLAR